MFNLSSVNFETIAQWPVAVAYGEVPCHCPFAEKFDVDSRYLERLFRLPLGQAMRKVRGLGLDQCPNP